MKRAERDARVESTPKAANLESGRKVLSTAENGERSRPLG